MMQSMTVTSAAMEKLSKKREAEKSKQPQDISGKKPIITVKNATDVLTEQNVLKERTGRNLWIKDTRL